VFLAAAFGILIPVAVAMGGPSADRWLRILAAIVIVMPLLWRSRAPVVVLAVVTGLAISAFAVLEVFRTPNIEYLWIPVLIALGAVAARRPLWVSLLALVVSYAAIVTSLFLGWPGIVDVGWALTLPTILCAVAWVLGVSAHAIRSRVDRLENERQLAQDAVREERDEIASGVEVVIEGAVRRMRSEAAAARRTIPSDAAATAAALSTVEAEGVHAMQELRQLVRRLDADTAEVRAASSGNVTESLRGRTRQQLLGFRASDLTVTLLAIAATIALTTVLSGGSLIAALVFVPALILLVWRNQFPIVVFALIAAAYACVVLLLHRGDFVWDNWLAVVGLLVALAAVAGGTRIWVSIPLAVFTLGYLSLAALAYPAVIVENVATYSLFVAVVWVVGFLGGRRRRRISQLEREREEAALRVRREHAELAHNLHDLIGHSITIMVLQAAGGRRIFSQDRGRAAAALDAIDAAGADALQELDQLVVLLRSTPESSVAQTLSPAGLAEIDALVRRTRSAMRTVELQVRGVPSSLSADVDVMAFAVVREALANAEKHAGEETKIGLELAWEADTLSIHITNTFDPAAPDASSSLSGGYGLTSLRARVHNVGGELTWAARQGDFSVSASFPLRTSLRAQH
jgi:signal transduction histidine kinase